MNTSQTINKIDSSNIDDRNWSITTKKGWECPRCGCINAPWIRQCDCSRNNWSITCTTDKITIGTKPEWWKDYVTCVQADAHVYTTDANPAVGGSDYKEGHIYVNVGGTQSNKVDSNVTAWSRTNPNNCRTPHYTTETAVNNDLEPLIRHFKD